jgi:hypothetical protein
MTLLYNEEPFYPKPFMGIPLLLLLVVPPIVSLFLITFRTLYTRFYVQSSMANDLPLDLLQCEEQRKFFLLPLSVSGVLMSVLPAYYFRHGKHFVLLMSQGGLGGLMVLLFLGIALIPESGKRDSQFKLFIPMYRK